MKKLFVSAIALAAIGGNVAAFDFEYGGLYYDILSESDRTVEVSEPADETHQDLPPYGGDVVIPEHVVYDSKTYTVTSIGMYAFYEGDQLTSVVIPNTVTNIDDKAFSDCINLTEINIPASVTTIGYRVFRNCDRLEAINVDANNPAYCSINGVLYTKDQTNIVRCPLTKTAITFPKTITVIGDYAFSCCHYLTRVDIPNTVTTIGYNAFSHCENLATVTVPESVTEVGDDAFYDCPSLSSITLSKTATTICDNMFSDCSSLTTFDIPESVTSIGVSAFSNCENLRSLTIPSEVTSIGNYAFSGCAKLKSLTCRAAVPPTVEAQTFESEVIKSGTLYVPNGCKSVYKAAAYWSDFGNIEEDAASVSDIVLDNTSAVEVFDVYGRKVCSGYQQDAISNLAPGIYIVKTGDVVVKVRI